MFIYCITGISASDADATARSASIIGHFPQGVSFDKFIVPGIARLLAIASRIYTTVWVGPI